MDENPEMQPLLVGGTGLYFETLIYGLDFQVNEETFSVRNELKQFLTQNGEDALYEMLLNAIPKARKAYTNTMSRELCALWKFTEPEAGKNLKHRLRIENPKWISNFTSSTNNGKSCTTR